MGAKVFSQVWKAYDVWRLRDDLGDADRPVLRRSPAWGEDASALYVDSLINGVPLSPMVVQSCRDAQGRATSVGRVAAGGGWLLSRKIACACPPGSCFTGRRGVARPWRPVA